jgi:hypothetical protein
VFSASFRGSTSCGAAARRQWQAWQPLRDMAQYVFLDECGVATDLLRRYGRSPGGTRLRDHAPFGHWETASLRRYENCSLERF